VINSVTFSITHVLKLDISSGWIAADKLSVKSLNSALYFHLYSNNAEVKFAQLINFGNTSTITVSNFTNTPHENQTVAV